MSRSKESFGFTGPRQRWSSTSQRRPCPVCGGHSWCSVRADGALVACRRNSGGRQREDRNGETFWLHRGDGAPIAERELPPEYTANRASLDACDAAYRALLAQLSLTQAHREALMRRGLDAAAIARGGYRSLAGSGRTALGRSVAAITSLEGVPGFHVAGTSWVVGGASGLLVPLRNLAGQIVALKVRRDDANAEPRYLYLSSTRHGGPSAVHALHVPVGIEPRSCALLRITEGELKADVATHLSGVPTLSVPGVGSWRLAIEAAKALEPQLIQIAFDTDWREKPAVARAARSLLDGLRSAGFAAEVLDWNPRFKGIDDLYAARMSAGLQLESHGRAA